MLTRRPISKGQQALYWELYNAGDKGMNNHELAEALSITPNQFAGLLGALGLRVEGTEGSEDYNGIGINLLFEVSRSGNLWHYSLQPAFRNYLEEKKFFDL